MRCISTNLTTQDWRQPSRLMSLVPFHYRQPYHTLIHKLIGFFWKPLPFLFQSLVTAVCEPHCHHGLGFFFFTPISIPNLTGPKRQPFSHDKVSCCLFGHFIGETWLENSSEEKKLYILPKRNHIDERVHVYVESVKNWHHWKCGWCVAKKRWQ